VKKAKRSASVRVSLTACVECRVTFEPAPGGATCPRCGERGVSALVIVPREGATVEAAAALLLDVLARMRELSARP
jgi:hypothetical protein